MARPTEGDADFSACAFLVGLRAASFLWVSIWETSVQTWRNGVMGMAMKTASMAAAGLLALAGEAALAAAVPQIPVRVVVVTTFENGPDSGPNSIGEFDRWVTNLPLPETIDFPQGYHHLRYNADKMVLGIETGQGPVHAASSITALGNDPRFDLSLDLPWESGELF